MSKDLIRYDLMVQDALKGVLRKLLTDAVRDGLPGEHHFYITFRTEAPGVRLSQRMREKYPEEMTVVLQHQFWDLGVTEHAFEVGLSFGGIPERLLVPFDSITGFFDPSVKFGLKFELQEDAAHAAAEDEPVQPKRPMLTSVPASDTEAAATPRPVRKSATKAVKASDEAALPEDAPDKDASRKPAAKPGAKPSPKPETAVPADDVAVAAKDAGTKDSGAQIVSLDAFRKKT
jgi:uncharacterized protein